MPHFHSVTRTFLTCHRVRDPRLANERGNGKAEVTVLPLPAILAVAALFPPEPGSRHIWFPPDPGVVPGLPSDTSLAHGKFILVCILTGAPATIRGRPLLVRVS